MPSPKVVEVRTDPGDDGVGQMGLGGQATEHLVIWPLVGAKRLLNSTALFSGCQAYPKIILRVRGDHKLASHPV